MLGRRNQIRQCYNYLSTCTLTKLLVNKSHSKCLSFLDLQHSLRLKQTAKWRCVSASTYLSFHWTLKYLLTYCLVALPLTWMLFKNTFLNHVKATSCRSLLSLFLNFFRLGFTWLNFYYEIIFALFAIHAYIVFFFTPYSSAKNFFSFFTFLQRFIFPCDWNVYSFLF